MLVISLGLHLNEAKLAKLVKLLVKPPNLAVELL